MMWHSEKGMAETLDITQQQYDEGFDNVIVLGVKNSDATTSKALIEDLFTNHIYAPDGMGLLKISTRPADPIPEVRLRSG